MTEKLLKALTNLKPMSKDERHKFITERRMSIDNFRWGYDDYLIGIPITDSPYLEDSLAHEQWTAGWQEAQDEALQNSLTDEKNSVKLDKEN